MIMIKFVDENDDVVEQPIGSTLDGLLRVFDTVAIIVAAKDQQYGVAWKSQGWMGNLARIMSKTSRLKAMLWKDNGNPVFGGKEVESVQDTLHDLIAITAFALINFGKANKWGEDQ